MTHPTRPRPLHSTVPLSADPAAVRQRIEMLERLLERSIPIPGMGSKIGLDAVAGLIPVAGDVISATLGLYLVWEAKRLGVPKWKIARMMMNVALDTTVGAIPLAGDLFDFVFRSNSMNLRILRRHLDRHHPQTAIIEG